MRYFLITILVLTLATPAISDCETSYKQLRVKTDCDLPDSSKAYSVAGCAEFAWSFHFTRTEKTAGQSTMIVRILGTNALEWLYSEDYAPGRYHLEWPGLVFSPENQIEIYMITGSCGYFSDMEIEAYNYH